MEVMAPPRAEKFLSSHPANDPALLVPSGQSSSDPFGTFRAVPPPMIPAQTTISTARFQKCFVQPPPYIYHQTQDYTPHFQYESFPILKATIMQPESAFLSSLLKHLQFPLGSQTQKAPEERMSTPRTRTQVLTVKTGNQHCPPATEALVLDSTITDARPHLHSLFPAPQAVLAQKTTSLTVSSQSWLVGLWKYRNLAACASMQHI